MPSPSLSKCGLCSCADPKGTEVWKGKQAPHHIQRSFLGQRFALLSFPSSCFPPHKKSASQWEKCVYCLAHNMLGAYQGLRAAPHRRFSLQRPQLGAAAGCVGAATSARAALWRRREIQPTLGSALRHGD